MMMEWRDQSDCLYVGPCERQDELAGAEEIGCRQEFWGLCLGLAFQLSFEPEFVGTMNLFVRMSCWILVLRLKQLWQQCHWSAETNFLLADLMFVRLPFPRLMFKLWHISFSLEPGMSNLLEYFWGTRTYIGNEFNNRNKELSSDILSSNSKHFNRKNCYIHVKNNRVDYALHIHSMSTTTMTSPFVVTSPHG